jgi:superoxide dismutase, Cu-Zn family
MTKYIALISASCATLFVAACATAPATGPRAEAKLEARSGSTVSGTVSFVQVADKLRIEAKVSGLTPGEHGFHVHESGDCSAPDASSAKGHFNPAAKSHGHHGGAERHAGDMPNLIADASGNASYKDELGMLSLGNDPAGIVGRSVVIHADPDDYKSQPAGNSGKRIACGTIKAL